MERREFLKLMVAGTTTVALAGIAEAGTTQKWVVRTCHSGMTERFDDGVIDLYCIDGVRRIAEVTREKLKAGPIPVFRNYRRKEEPVGHIVEVCTVKTTPLTIAIEMVIESEHDLTGLYLGPTLQVPENIDKMFLGKPEYVGKIPPRKDIPVIGVDANPVTPVTIAGFWSRSKPEWQKEMHIIDAGAVLDVLDWSMNDNTVYVFEGSRTDLQRAQRLWA